MKVANIISSNKITIPDDFNVVKTLDEAIVGLPTLIIGYEYVNKHYPDFDISNFCLGPDLYWTFKRTERRDNFEEDLNRFIKKVYKELTNDIIYVFVDPIQYKSKTLIKIVRKIYSLKNIISFINGNMVYLYSDKFIFGIDLKLLKFMGIDIDKIKNKIKSISSDFLDDNKILIEYKKTVDALDNQVRYIPFLFSIKNEQNNTSSLIHIP